MPRNWDYSEDAREQAHENLWKVTIKNSDGEVLKEKIHVGEYPAWLETLPIFGNLDEVTAVSIPGR